MNVVALYNPASGSVSADGGDKLKAALAANGISDADFVELDRSACEKQFRTIAEAKPDLFIVWGGDGTLRTALSGVGQMGANLLLLPGGTMNMLTKSIHGDKPWDAILRDVIAAPKVKTVSAGRVNDENFYCALLAGTPARLADARESLRKGDLLQAASQAREALGTLENMHLEGRYRDGYTFERTTMPVTSIIGVLVGPLAHEHEMEVASLVDPTAAGALNVIWASLVGDWRSAPGVTIVPARSLVIEAEEGDIPVIIDGEPLEVGNILRVAFVKDAAQCMTAATHE